MKYLYFFSLKRSLAICAILLSPLLYTKAKASFVLNCPPNKYVTCTDDLYNLSRFGNATYSIHYVTYSAGAPVVQYHLNSCHVGYITRTWMVEDPYWNWHTCTQTIYVSQSNYNPLHINWPPDYEVEGCQPEVKPHQLPAPYNSPTWSGDECRMIGKSYSDMVFTVNNGCKKIMRTWKLIDWCDNNGWGTSWTHNQIIKIINEERPVVDCPGQVNGNSFNCKNAQVNVPPLHVGSTSCGGSAVISNNSPYSTEKGANISGVYPIGTTKVTYTIQYGCGSRLYCHVNVVVKNASAPTAYCLHGIVTALMPVDTNGDGTPENGMVDIWAKDLDKGSKSLCNYYPLRFSFSEDPNDMSRRFTCDELGTNGVMIFITDSKGGQSACMVNIEIQNNSSNIPDCKRKEENPNDSLVISHDGVLHNSFGDAIAGAKVDLTYDEPELLITTTHDTLEILKKDSFYNASGYLIYFFKKELQITTKSDTNRIFKKWEAVTDNEGVFVFDSLPELQKPFELNVFYQEADRKNIDGKDVEFLTKFLLGEKEFQNAYQYLAADIDDNGLVNITDLNLLLNYVTAVTNELPGKKWKYIKKSLNFNKPEDVLKADISQMVFSDSIADMRIVGVKKGDITRDAQIIEQNSTTEIRNIFSSSPLINVYPNPSTDILQIAVNAAGTFNLLSMDGKLIISEFFGSKGKYQLQNQMISQLPAGIYMFRFESENSVHSGKWIKL